MTKVERRLERRTALGTGAAQYLVRPLADAGEILALLQPRRAYAAYALAQLEPELFPLSVWWIASGTTGQALLLHSRGGLGAASWAMGDPSALHAVLGLHPGPYQSFFTCEPDHLAAATRHFRLKQGQTMLRLQVTAESFLAMRGEVYRLSGHDARQVSRLNRSEGWPAFYTPANIEQGIYFGAYEGEELVAVAGTHAVSPTYAIGVVGNVYTHPDYRNRGLGTATTSAVTEELLRTCREVVLSVEPGNRAAVRAYQKLGYREVGRLVEASTVRRDLLGLAALLRRFLAALRGRRYGGELVEMTVAERNSP
jgi:RimJ/RimL family protein N-acetyltransferase